VEVRKSNVATPVAVMATLQRTLGRSVAMVLPAAAVADGREKARKRDEALQAALFARDDSQRQCAPQNVMKNRRQERMMMTDKKVIAVSGLGSPTEEQAFSPEQPSTRPE
jgi:hypothetical protein